MIDRDEVIKEINSNRNRAKGLAESLRQLPARIVQVMPPLILF